MGRGKDARAAFEQAVRQELKRDNLLALVHFYIEAGDLAEATGPIQRAVQRSCRNAISVLSQAVLLWCENRREAALAALARAQERDRSVTRLDDLRYDHFWRTKALTALQEMLDAQAAAERQTP